MQLEKTFSWRTYRSAYLLNYATRIWNFICETLLIKLIQCTWIPIYMLHLNYFRWFGSLILDVIMKMLVNQNNKDDVGLPERFIEINTLTVKVMKISEMQMKYSWTICRESIACRGWSYSTWSMQIWKAIGNLTTMQQQKSRYEFAYKKCVEKWWSDSSSLDKYLDPPIDNQYQLGLF